MRTGQRDRLRAKLLRFAQSAWPPLAALCIVLYLVALPGTYELWQTPCDAASCSGSRFTESQAANFARQGISLAWVAAYSLISNAGFAMVFLLVAALLYARRGSERLPLLGAYAFLLFGLVTFSDSLAPLAALHPVVTALVLGLKFTGDVAIFAFFLLFPDGRFVPGWMRWVLVFWVVSALFRVLLPRTPVSDFFDGPGFLVPLATMAFSQIYRYRRTDSPVLRQQTKWVAYGMSVGIAGFVAIVYFLGPSIFAQSDDPANGLNVATYVLGTVGIYLSIAMMPISIAIAILRYRLYDIDLLINRTLVYGALSAALAATYFGAVALLQSALRPLTGESELAVAGSTLAVVALAAPLRRRIQGAVDRRFYRSRYDAARTLDAFGARLRDEVDLDSVRADLLDVVHDTVRPAHASVWLRGSRRSR